MEEDFRARLLADQALAAKVGGRIDWGLRPGAALPALTLTLVSSVPSYTYQGRTVLGWSRVQIDSWGASMKDAVTTARLLAPLLLPRADVGGTHFEPTFVEGEHDGPTEEGAAGKLTYSRTIDFIVWHRPAA